MPVKLVLVFWPTDHAVVWDAVVCYAAVWDAAAADVYLESYLNFLKPCSSPNCVAKLLVNESIGSAFLPVGFPEPGFGPTNLCEHLLAC